MNDTPTFTPSPEAVTEALSLQRQALTATHHSERMSLSQRALGLRTGKLLPSAPQPPASTTQPVVPQVAPPVPSTPMDTVAASFDMSAAEMTAANEAMAERFDGFTAYGLAHATQSGSKALDALTSAVESLEGPALDAYLSNARSRVDSLYQSPEHRTAAAENLRDAANLLFGAKAGEVLADIELLWTYDPAMHNRINMVANQVLRGARRK